MNSMFLTVFLIGLVAVVSPGPDFFVVMRNSLLYTRKVGIVTAFGIVTGNVWWIACSILGISYVISQTVILFNILKWIGALYLIYLGICALRSKKATSNDDPISPQIRHMTLVQAFRTGLLTNILNPKCALFFMSFFSVIISHDTPMYERFAYGAEIMLIAIVWFSLVATFLSIGVIRKWFKRIAHWVDRLFGAIMVALGIKIALSRI